MFHGFFIVVVESPLNNAAVVTVGNKLSGKANTAQVNKKGGQETNRLFQNYRKFSFMRTTNAQPACYRRSASWQPHLVRAQRSCCVQE